MKKFEVAGYDMPCVDLAVNVDVFPKPNGGTGINALSWQGGGKVATALTMLIGRCTQAFEVLPLVQDVEILRSVLYSGVWAK